MGGIHAKFKTDGDKINTLEGALREFGLDHLLKDLDALLMLVRQHKKAKDEHLQCLKKADNRLLKLSISFHPDRLVNKTDETVTGRAQELQAALNATRTVLHTLTSIFLESIDIDYQYEFFSNLDLNKLLNDQERDLLIGRLSRELRKMTKLKQDVVIREIRKFLLKSRKSIASFLEHDVGDFERYRDHAVYHLEKCIQGYETLDSECSILETRCDDIRVKCAIQKVAQQNARESNLLRDLQKETRKSLGRTFCFFSILGTTDAFVEYFVLPFLYHMSILLMCTLIVDRRMRIQGKNRDIDLPLYGREPNLYLTAYYLACYFNDRNLCREEVACILHEKNLPRSEINVVKVFRDNLKKIDSFLAGEFKIECYDAGKTCEEEFCDRLTRLTAVAIEIQEERKDLMEKINQCIIENDEIFKCTK